MSKTQKVIYVLLFVLLFSSLIFIQYYGLVHYRYPVPPGDDPASHYQMTMQFYNHETTVLASWKIGAYPPGYHLLVANAAHWLNTNPLKVILWSYPAVLILAGLAIGVLTYGLFGPWAGLLAFTIYSFTTQSTIQLLNDGGYPNLLAGHTFLPLFFLFLIKFLQKKRFIYLFSSLIFAGLIVCTHHATTLVLMSMVAVILPILIISFAIRKKWSWRKCSSLLVSSFLILILFIIALMKSELLAPAKALLNSTVGITSTFPYLNLSAKVGKFAIWEIKNYPMQIGPMATYLGLIGLIGLILITTIKKKKDFYIPMIVLTVWIFLLFVGSRMNFLSNPERMGRDLAVPISVLAGGFMVVLIDQFKTYGVKIFLVVTAIILIGWNIPQRVNGALGYQPMVRVTPADQEAIEFLKSQPAGKLLVRDYNYYLPILLPNWTFVYYPDDNISIKTIRQYDYAYIITRQDGWAPEGYQQGALRNYFSDEVLSDYYTFSSDTKEICLVKIKKLE